MTVEDLFKIFINHKHDGTVNSGPKIPVLDKTTIISNYLKSPIILISDNGSKFILTVDDDGALKTIKI